MFSPNLGINAAAGPFSPASISNLTAWFKADAGITKNASDLVSAWKDQSSNGYSAVQATGARQPTWTSNVQNSLPAVYFSSQWLNVASGVTAFASTFPQHTIYTAFRPNLTQTSDTYHGHFCASNAGATNQNSAIGVLSTSTDKRHWFGGYGQDFNWGPTTPQYTQTWYFNGKVWNGTNVIGYSNGTQIISKATTYTSGNGQIDLGRQFNSTSLGLYIGYVGEVVLYAKALSATERQQIEGYLAWRWGLQANLPSGHPYASAPP